MFALFFMLHLQHVPKHYFSTINETLLQAHATTSDGFALNSLSTPYTYLLIFFGLLFIILLVFSLKKHSQYHKSIHHLQKSQEQLDSALWASGDGLWDWDITSGEICRKGAIEMLGYSQDEFNSTTEHMMQLIHPDDIDDVKKLIELHLSGLQDDFEIEYRILAKNGQWRWILDRGKVIAWDKERNPIRAAGTLKDITKRKNTENELRLAAEVIQSMNEVVVITDSDLKIQLVNDAFIQLMGRSETEVMGLPLHNFFSSRHNHSFYTDILKNIRQKGYWSGELWQTNHKSNEILTKMEIKTVQQFKKDKSFFVAIFSDITEKKRSEDKLVYLANYDTLTGLPNRTLFHQRLQNHIQESNKKIRNDSFALICIDIDNFKRVNDTLGLSIGDTLIQLIALKIRKQVCFHNATVAHLGGDEFTILLPYRGRRKEINTVAKSILDTFKKPIFVEHQEIMVSASLGISCFPEDGKTPSMLFRNAESALHYAKKKGGNNHQFFNEDLQASASRKTKIFDLLSKAIKKNELALLYQPKINLDNNQTVGFEALLRWHNQEIGIINTQEFISIAEESGLVNEIGLWVLKAACHQAKTWEQSGKKIPISINISAKQFSQPDLYRIISHALYTEKLSPEMLELEITETMIMEDPEIAITTLEKIKNLGIKIAIDDFGTGYSSLSYLKKLPIDTLKIDKAFVNDVTTDLDDEAITNAIISLAKNLDLNVVAEGVETYEQLEFLKKAGCKHIQGYLIAPPMNSQDCESFFKEKDLV